MGFRFNPFTGILDIVNPTSNVNLPSGGAVYFGDSATNGSWRIIRSGNDLVIERRESGSWVEKGAFLAA